MPACDVTVMIGKRAKVVTVEIAKNADLGQFETTGDLIAHLALEQEPNADKVAHVSGLYATKKEIEAELKKLKASDAPATAFVAGE